MSARPPSTASIKRPVLAPVSAHGSAHASELRLGVHDALDDAEQVEGAAREPVDPRYGHNIARAGLPSIRLSWRRSTRTPVTFSR